MPHNSPPHTRPYSQIVITGDSIAGQSFGGKGYGARLAGEYNGLCDVLNRAFPGYSSGQLLDAFKGGLHLSMDADVLLFIIHIGTNDCVIDGLQTAALDDFERNLRGIFELIKQRYSSAEVIYITPRMPESLILKHLRSNENAKRYADSAKQVCKMMGIPVVDAWEKLHEEEQNGVSLEKLLPDGLHWSTSAFTVICAALFDIIRKSFPHLMPHQIKQPYEIFADLGHASDPSWDSLRLHLPVIMANLATFQAELGPKFAQ